jgi:hypothetical protein
LVYLGARHKQQVAGRGKKVLMAAKYLAHPAFGTVAQHGFSDRLGRGNEAGAAEGGTTLGE